MRLFPDMTMGQMMSVLWIAYRSWAPVFTSCYLVGLHCQSVLLSVLCLFCLCSFCVLCSQSCQCLWIVNSWLSLQFSLTFSYVSFTGICTFMSYNGQSILRTSLGPVKECNNSTGIVHWHKMDRKYFVRLWDQFNKFKRWIRTHIYLKITRIYSVRGWDQ
jgi:hypothetical protein